ncbi:MAG: hypothetical protein ACYSTT_12460 [Planctomycetota bacterium]
MSSHCRSCHGRFDCLHTSSSARLMNRPFKVYQKVRSYVVWHVENIGFWRMLTNVLTCKSPSRSKCIIFKQPLAGNEKLPNDSDVLGLRPGELVEVKSIDDILATLGPDRKYKGLLWMTGMRKFCGKRYRVLKRIENILLETNGDSRKMKNTVILEGVMCDGAEFGSCDRSCFHFWREAWLKRIEKKD